MFHPFLKVLLVHVLVVVNFFTGPTNTQPTLLSNATTNFVRIIFCALSPIMQKPAVLGYRMQNDTSSTLPPPVLMMRSPGLPQVLPVACR